MLSLRVRLGRAIRRLREELGLSQEAFAHRVRLHRTHVGGLERAEYNPSLSTLEQVAKGLGITVAQLFAEAEREK